MPPRHSLHAAAAPVTFRYLTRVRVAKSRGRPSKPAMEALAERFSHVVAADLFHGMTGFKADTSYQQMANAVYSGRYRRAVEQVPWDKLDDRVASGLKNVGSAMAGASRLGAEELRSQSSDVSAARARELSLGTDNPKIDEYLSVRTGELVTRITDDTQVQIQRAVRRAKETGATPRDIAADIKGVIGLNDRQATALMNYRNQLAADGTSPSRLQKMSDRYENQLLQQRAMMIARTEVAYASNQGQLAVWDAAMKRGLLPDTATKVWVVDGDPCPVCEDLSGSEVRIREMFDTNLGDQIPGPPAHPHCRCTLSLNTDADAGGDADAEEA